MTGRRESLRDPNPDDPCVPELASICKTSAYYRPQYCTAIKLRALDRPLYDQLAREATQRYAIDGHAPETLVRYYTWFMANVRLEKLP